MTQTTYLLSYSSSPQLLLASVFPTKHPGGTKKFQTQQDKNPRISVEISGQQKVKFTILSGDLMKFALFAKMSDTKGQALNKKA